jgi:bifunctional lysine-specific demethylase and histidyl-hydroxylase NO66
VTLSLEDLVGDTRRFFAEDWTRRAVVHESEQTQKLAGLFGLADVDRLLDGGLRAPAVRIVRSGAPVDSRDYLKTIHTGGRTITDAVDAVRARSLFAAGATLVFQGAHRYHERIREICEQLEAKIGHPIQANAYVSPREARGLPTHHDTHDVFAVQTFGTKAWSLYETVVELPVDKLDVPVRYDSVAEPIRRCRLSAGSCLYLPRGIPHTAVTESDASIHVTLGVRSPTWLDVFQRLVEQAAQERAFREPLPVKYADHRDGFEQELAMRLETWAGWLRRQSIPAILEREVALVRPPARAALPASISEIVSFSELADDTRLERSARGSGLELRVGVEHVELELTGRTLRFPARVADAVRFAVETPEFTIGELAEHLDTEGRRTLCRRLLAEGVLERSRAR